MFKYLTMDLEEMMNEYASFPYNFTNDGAKISIERVYPNGDFGLILDIEENTDSSVSYNSPNYWEENVRLTEAEYQKIKKEVYTIIKLHNKKKV